MYHFNCRLLFFKLLYYLKIKSNNLYRHLANLTKTLFLYNYELTNPHLFPLVRYIKFS